MSRLVGDAGKQYTYTPRSTAHGVYIFVVDGEVRCGNTVLGRRDSYGIWGVDKIECAVTADDSDVFIIETIMIDDARIKAWGKGTGRSPPLTRWRRFLPSSTMGRQMQDTDDRQQIRRDVNVVFAAYLGWTLDAFDFFIMAFVLREVAASFNVPIEDVAVAMMLTLGFRAVGAVLFGRLADRFGRRPILMVNVLCYALLEFCSGLAPTLTAFLILRAL